MDTNNLEQLQRRIEALEMAETIRKLKDELVRERKEKEALKRQIAGFLWSFENVFDCDFSFTVYSSNDLLWGLPQQSSNKALV